MPNHGSLLNPFVVLADVLTFSPHSIPPRPIYAACMAAKVQWSEWMTALGNIEFDLIVDLGCGSVRFIEPLSTTNLITVWSDEPAAEEPRAKFANTLANSSLQAQQPARAVATPTVNQFSSTIPQKSVSPASSGSHHSRSSSLSSMSDSGSWLSFDSEDSDSSVTWSTYRSYQWLHSHPPRPRPPRHGLKLKRCAQSHLLILLVDAPTSSSSSSMCPPPRPPCQRAHLLVLLVDAPTSSSSSSLMCPPPQGSGPYHGFMLDTARKFFPVSDIEQTLDAMSWIHLNTFHWHIVDSQSFLLVMPNFQDIAQKGAYSADSVYTPQDVAHIVSYAGARGIDVLVKINTSGHTAVISKAHPEHIACAEATPWSTYMNEPPAGQLRLASPGTINFTVGMLSSVAGLFPSKLFSTGGDEINAQCYAGRTLEQALDAFTQVMHGALKNFAPPQNKEGS
ncbi:glycoside hydrolase superfamily [Russula emetica]|nr:glycoside hydrolase superfamily [Russula emetica]